MTTELDRVEGERGSVWEARGSPRGELQAGGWDAGMDICHARILSMEGDRVGCTTQVGCGAEAALC